MRNPKRIKRILNKLEKVWKKQPDLRLGQLLYSLAYLDAKDIFYYEDECLEKTLDENS
jgi:uncharacterized protein YihD (DUF1040 family)